MAQNGGILPTVQMVSSPARVQPQSPPGTREFISLVQPRPNNNRKQNEYIDTPLRPQSHKARLKEDRRNDIVANISLPEVHRNPRNNTRINTQSVIVQPTVTTFKKEKYTDVAERLEDHGDSIICRQCGKCKCESCKSSKQLPSRWICNDKCLCSVQNVVDYCTCLCCVKGLFYHWAKDYDMDGASCADNPCSCGPQHRYARWACMGVMSILLPCLCLYWPLNGCVKLCGVSYAKVTNRGCSCTQHHRTIVPIERAPEKRLLNSNFDCWLSKKKMNDTTHFEKEFVFFMCVHIVCLNYDKLEFRRLGMPSTVSI